MSIGEGLPEEPFDIAAAFEGWEVPPSNYFDLVLAGAFDNFADNQAARGVSTHLHGHENVTHALTVGHEANTLAVTATANGNSSQARLGYFWGGKFVTFNERFDPTGWRQLDEGGGLKEEIGQITQRAQLEREKFLAEYNESPAAITRLDFGDPRIVELHQEQHHFLDAHILEPLLRRRNEIIKDNPYQAEYQQTPSQLLYADDATRAAVCLRTEAYGIRENDLGSRYLRTIVSVAMMGLYITTPDRKHKFRQPMEYIDVAYTEEEDYLYLRPDEVEIIDDLITTEELDGVVSLANGVIELACEYEIEGIEFDKRLLGARVPPLVADLDGTE